MTALHDPDAIRPDPPRGADWQKNNRVIVELLDDAQNKAFFGLLTALCAWGGLLAGWHVHIPFLPVWLLASSGLMLLRHVSRTIGKGLARGQFETALKNFTEMSPSDHLRSEAGEVKGGPYL
jgi:hypothetical protein